MDLGSKRRQKYTSLWAKTEAQQTLSVLHRLRESLVGERTKAVNQMHGFLLEFGISLPQGPSAMKRLATSWQSMNFQSG